MHGKETFCLFPIVGNLTFSAVPSIKQFWIIYPTLIVKPKYQTTLNNQANPNCQTQVSNYSE